MLYTVRNEAVYCVAPPHPLLQHCHQLGIFTTKAFFKF